MHLIPTTTKLVVGTNFDMWEYVIGAKSCT
jgi:hypothetical protein